MSCYRYEGAWFVRNRHQDECPGQCSGCESCANHCTCREGCPEHTSDAYPLTSPVCVGKTRRDITEVVELAALMLTEALHKGVRSEAASMAGPAADSESWSWHRLAQRSAGAEWDTIEGDDPAHPLVVLGTWDFMLREDYGQLTTERATVVTCAAYLDRTLVRFAQDENQDYPLFTRELRICRTRLEAVLSNSKRAATTKVPCIDCGRNLVRKYRDEAKDDHHQCPGCRKTYDAKQFTLAKANLLASEGADRHVLLSDAKATIDRPERTWSKWLRFWHVRSYRDPITGLVYVWWPDARDADLNTQRRKAAA